MALLLVTSVSERCTKCDLMIDSDEIHSVNGESVDDIPEIFKRQSGDGSEFIDDSSNIPEMLKPQSGDDL